MECRETDSSAPQRPEQPVPISPISAEAAKQSINVAGLIDHLTEKNIPFQLPQDVGWKHQTTTYNTRLPFCPAVVVLPDNHEHVAAAVLCAAAHGVKVQAKSGGHSYASFSMGGQDGSMVVDLANFQGVAVSEDGIAKVGAGTRLGNLDLAIYEHQRALAHGTWPGVGVGGHFTHGGYGYSSRAWGLALDQITALDVVLANGELVHASETENPDVFFVS